jgi:hypothetical protein
MTNTTELAQQISELMDAIQTGALQVPPQPTREEQLQEAFAKIKAVKPDYTFEEFLEELDREEIKNCLYFQHLPEALEKGVFFEADFFQDAERSREMCLKSKFVLVPNKAWADIIGSNLFAKQFDPAAQCDLVLNGNLGTLEGCAYYTDAFMPPHLKDKSVAAGKVVFVPRDSE